MKGSLPSPLWSPAVPNPSVTTGRSAGSNLDFIDFQSGRSNLGGQSGRSGLDLHIGRSRSAGQSLVAPLQDFSAARSSSTNFVGLCPAKIGAPVPDGRSLLPDGRPPPPEAPSPLRDARSPLRENRRINMSDLFGNTDGGFLQSAEASDVLCLKGMISKVGASVLSVEKSVKCIEEKFNSLNMSSDMCQPQILKVIKDFCSKYEQWQGEHDAMKTPILRVPSTPQAADSSLKMGTPRRGIVSEDYESSKKEATVVMGAPHSRVAAPWLPPVSPTANIAKVASDRINVNASNAAPEKQFTLTDTGRVSSFSNNPLAPPQEYENEEQMLGAIFVIDEAAEKLQHDDHRLGVGSLTKVFMAGCALDEHAYSVCDFYKTTGIFQAIARSSKFDNATMVVVIINAIYIGIDSDWNDASNLFDADLVFIVFTAVFSAFFVLELFIRFMAFDVKMNCLLDGWFVFDLFLVVTMIADNFIMMPILKLMTTGKKFKIPTQPLRMLRLFKITRMARLMKVFPELVILVRSMSKSVRAGSSIAFVIIVLNYVWGILMHMLLHDEDALNDIIHRQSYMDFRTVMKCMWILMMDGTFLLDNSAPLMTQLLFSKDWKVFIAGIAFVAYMLLSATLIMQTLIGMLVDVVSQVNTEQKNEMASALLKQELLDNLIEFSGDDGMVSHYELMTLMANRKAKAVLKRLKINTFLLYELQKMLYSGNYGKDMPIKKIFELMLLCRGDESVTVDTLARGLNFVCQDLQEIKQKVAGSNEHITKIPTFLG